MRDVAILVSTYQRPWNLERVLTSIECQRGVRDRIELVVTDDGSADGTREVVDKFAERAGFAVAFTTHRHVTYQLARCRNEGVAASTAPYLVFLDGDCLIPPDHVWQHLRRRRRGAAMAGFSCRLDEAASQRVTLDAVRSGEYAKWAPYSERLKLARMDFKARLYNLLRHPTKPKLFGSNLGIWREDYERVNGYDEKFEGWGCEDDDLRLRLRQAGVRIRSISRWTCTHHLWHPVDVTFPKTGRWRDNANVKHIRRKRRLTRCLNGMTKRAAGDLKIRVVGRPARPELAEKLLGATLAQAAHGEDSDFEVLFLPGDGSYTGRADCKVLVVLEETPAAAKAARKADVVVAERRYPGVDEGCSFRLDQFDQALQAVA